MMHPGVGPLTALAFVLITGKAERFRSGKQIASYLGLVPLEESSGNRRCLGHITKQGSSMMRFLLVEAAQVTVRSLPTWRNKYVHLTMRRGRKTAKVAVARQLAVYLYWMWRKGWDYEQVNKFGSHAGQPEYRHGVQSINCLTPPTLSERRFFTSYPGETPDTRYPSLTRPASGPRISRLRDKLGRSARPQ